MKLYKLIYHFANGDQEVDDNYGMFYPSLEEAKEAGEYGLSCLKLGGEILGMTNIGDDPFDENDYEDDTFEVVEVNKGEVL